MEPDGIFKINGEDASSKSIHDASDSTVTIEFVPVVKREENIKRVYVHISLRNKINAVTLERQVGGTYRGTYELKLHGIYEAKGYVSWTGGDPLLKMHTNIRYNPSEKKGGGSPTCLGSDERNAERNLSTENKEEKEWLDKERRQPLSLRFSQDF